MAQAAPHSKASCRRMELVSLRVVARTVTDLDHAAVQLELWSSEGDAEPV